MEEGRGSTGDELPFDQTYNPLVLGCRGVPVVSVSVAYK